MLNPGPQTVSAHPRNHHETPCLLLAQRITVKEKLSSLESSLDEIQREVEGTPFTYKCVSVKASACTDAAHSAPAPRQRRLVADRGPWLWMGGSLTLTTPGDSQVKQARNLPIMDTTKSDPYIVLTIGDTSKRTSVKRGQLNPVPPGPTTAPSPPPVPRPPRRPAGRHPPARGRNGTRR